MRKRAIHTVTEIGLACFTCCGRVSAKGCVCVCVCVCVCSLQVYLQYWRNFDLLIQKCRSPLSKIKNCTVHISISLQHRLTWPRIKDATVFPFHQFLYTFIEINRIFKHKLLTKISCAVVWRRLTSSIPNSSEISTRRMFAIVVTCAVETSPSRLELSLC